MKITGKFLPLTFLFSFSVIANCWSQTISLESDSIELNKYLGRFSAPGVYDHIATLASDAFGGRKMGHAGMDSAACYLETEFKKIGLKHIGSSYRQEFSIFDWIYSSQSLYSEKVETKVFPTWNGSLKDSTELTFVGNGNEKDYSGLGFENKTVAYYYNKGNPSDPSKSQTTIARNNGAKYQIIVHRSQETFDYTMFKSRVFAPRASLVDHNSKETRAMLFNMLEEDYLKLYSQDQKEIIEQFNRTGKLARKQRRDLNKKISFDINYQTKSLATSNIIGIIEGTDLKDEAIVLTAHYDHLGLTQNEIFNGADDNASGTAALLEIAKIFMKAKNEGSAPRRTIIFVAFSAEEVGLLGSEFYATNPIFPLEKTVANLNFDMIGRVNEEHKEKPDYVFVVGSGDRSTSIYQINELVASKYLPELKLDYSHDGESSTEQLYKRSDQYHFINNNIPALLYTDLMRRDYHKSSDTSDKIDLEQLKKRMQLGFATAWELANRNRF